jgi:DNA mismatch repair protein MutS
MNSLKVYHMKVSYNEEDDVLVYDRKLTEGPGEPLYGIECCKGLHLNKDFLKMASNIRKEIMGKKPTRTSRYNEKLIIDNCYICDSTHDLHTHHIVEQYKADKDGFVGIFHKDNIHNLVVLCEECHKKVHQNKITITGWKFTSQGNKLEYIIN